MIARVITQGGEDWVSINDLVRAIKDDDAMTKLGAMLKVSRDKGDAALDSLRLAVAYWLTELTGTLAHTTN